MKKLILLILISLSLLITMSGCNDNSEANSPLDNTLNDITESTTPSNTIESTTDDFILEDPPIPSYAMSSKQPTEWETKNGEVPISLSFGLIAGQNTSDYCTNIVFTVENEHGQIYEFKNIAIEEIEKPEYVVNYVRENNENVYAHTESITLPLAVFSGDSGTVLILMREWVDDGTTDGKMG